MVFVRRDEDAQVIGMSRWPHIGFAEQVAENDPALLAYYDRQANRSVEAEGLTVEELYNMLELKGTLTASDRPRPKP